MEAIPHPKNPVWLGALARADESTGIKSLVEYLLKLARTPVLEHRRFSDAGVELDSHTLGNDSLLNTALDLIGIPSENTVEEVAFHGYPDGFFRDNTYCRDWIESVFQTMVVEREDYERFIEALKNPSEWIPDSWSSDDDLRDMMYGDENG